jgi:hypothetical protein
MVVKNECNRVVQQAPPADHGKLRRWLKYCDAAQKATTPTVAKVECGHDHRLGCPRPIARFSVRLSVLRRWWRTSALRLFLTEMGNLVRRMAGICEIHAWELLGHVGTPPILSGWTPLVGPQRYRRACIEYMQQMQTRHPFLSILDLFLLETSWRAGAKWRDCTHTSQNQEVWEPYTSSKGGNFMPLPATQQPPKDA